MVKSGYPDQTIGKEGFFMQFLRKKGLFESNKVLSLPISILAPNPNQPRQHFSQQGLEELSESIAQHGILQPLSVRRCANGYELISGERRLRAARLAGLSEVPCIVVNVDPQESSLLALIENVQRRDLDFWEEAQALQALIDATGLSQEAVARQIGKSQSAVANKLRLLKLSPEAVKLLRRSGHTERHARALLRLPAEAQEAAAHYVVSHDLTVAKTEEYVEALLSPAPRKAKPTFILKDVRLFLNTVTHGLSMMQSAGVRADCQRQDTEEAILLTIRIPRQAAAG
jgi:ParB family chromosome partitioning protein